jgi:3-dehydroquinate dehydratase I
MICVSIGYKNTDRVIEILEEVDFAEIRFDLCDIPIGHLGIVFSTGRQLIATFRQKNGIPDDLRIEYLAKSIELGAEYIDLSPDTDIIFVGELINKAKEKGCRVILSHHDFEKVPGFDEIKTVIKNYLLLEPDIIKLAFKPQNISENDVFKEIYNYYNNLKTNTKLICFGLGKAATQTRFESLKLGAPFLYAYPDGEIETAEGQNSYSEAKKLINLNI